MIFARSEDILHKVKILQVLTSIVDNKTLRQNLVFKGGTCAAMLGYLDRFSVDLDFDLIIGADKNKSGIEMEEVFRTCGLEIGKKSKETLNFLLKYDSLPGKRNTMEIDILGFGFKNDKTQVVYLPEIERYFRCQTVETMFSHKLCAVLDRYKKHRKIAGRDIYDIKYFFTQGYHWSPSIIQERTGKGEKKFIAELSIFIEKKVNQRHLDEDLNGLLEYEKFKKVRLTLKQEVLFFLKNTN